MTHPPTFKLGTINNIGHFFHENLFYAIEAYLRDPTTQWILHNELTEWERGITLMCAKHLGIAYAVEDLTGYGYRSLQRNISLSPYFRKILKIVKDAAEKEFPDAKFQPKYRVLYFRDDASRRRMRGYARQLHKYFDEVVYNMAAYSFEDQVRLFMRCSHFVTVEGACLTNVIFMDNRAKVLDISTTDNSWQMMFGTACCVGSFERMVLGLPNFDLDIQYNEDIENRIRVFLDSIQ